MSKLMKARCPDYQIFSLDHFGNIISCGERMQKKLQAIPLPDLNGKKVLDIGCDFGFWTFKAANLGASMVLGLDRNRPVRGEMFDIIASNMEVALEHEKLRNCYFEKINIGKQWHTFGKFDVVFLFSLYHHIFENCGDHESIWFWLSQHVAPDGVLIWENPLDVSDSVAHANISADKHGQYNKQAILGAAEKYFNMEYVGAALHEPTRYVYRCTPKKKHHELFDGIAEAGAGGATKAFEYCANRRSKEIMSTVGIYPFAGSLNVKTAQNFDWTRGYYRAKILDVVNRQNGFDSEWSLRWARFYPVIINNIKGFVFRFEGETYNNNFVEIIAPKRIRDILRNNKVSFERL